MLKKICENAYMQAHQHLACALRMPKKLKLGRYIVIQRRDRETLHTIIEREVQVGSIIHSDRWILGNIVTFNGFSQSGYIHEVLQ